MREETLVIKIDKCKAHRKRNCPECLALMSKELQDLEEKEAKS